MIAAVSLGLVSLASWQAMTTVPEPSIVDVWADRIAGCESGSGPTSTYSLTAENPRSTASGKYQFLSGTWSAVTGLSPPASAYDEATQDAAFIALWDDGRGASHWNASRECWR